MGRASAGGVLFLLHRIAIREKGLPPLTHPLELSRAREITAISHPENLAYKRLLHDCMIEAIMVVDHAGRRISHNGG